MEGNGLKTHISEIDAINPQFEQLLADVWVGIALTLLLLSCVCCMCSCLLYHKFQQWKRSVLRNTEDPDIGTPNSINIDCESLPSYTIASGLPSYEEAVQMDKKLMNAPNKQDSNVSQAPTIQSVGRSSLLTYFQSFVQEKT